MQRQYKNAETEEVCFEWELEVYFDEFLDDVYGTVNLAGYDYDTSRLLKMADLDAYHEAWLSWLDDFGWNEYQEQSS